MKTMMKKSFKLAILWMSRSIGLFRLFRVLSSSKIRIICYHGGNINDENQYKSLTFCTSNHLDSRVHWLLNKGFSIISMDHAMSLLRSKTPSPKLPTVLTFDDGWYSTYRELLPVLKKHNLPSTLYLCTKHFIEGWPVPAVTTRYIIWKSKMKHEVDIIGFGENVDGRYDIGDSTATKELSEKMTQWLTENVFARDEMCFSLKKFALLLGVSAESLNLDSRRFEYISKHELIQLPFYNCAVELHGHVHHYPLGNPSELKADLEACRQIIIDCGLPQGNHYCYPSGNYDDQSYIALSDIGIQSATITEPGLATIADGKKEYYLPRFLDGENISDLEFEAELSGFTNFVRRLVRCS